MIVDVKGKLFNPPKQWWDSSFSRQLFADEIMNTYKDNLALGMWFKLNELRKLCGARRCSRITHRREF